MSEHLAATRVGDLISISSAPAVVSLTDLERVRQELSRGGDVGEELSSLLTHYCLDDPDTRGAFDVIVSGLGRQEALGASTSLQDPDGSLQGPRGALSLAPPIRQAQGEPRAESRGGDAFHVQGVYGAGKSHLLAALALLCGHPELAWPAFLDTHRQYAELAARFAKPRLVAAIALDEYPLRTHPLEHIVLSRIEHEFAARHGMRVALTEQSHLLELVDRYVVPFDSAQGKPQVSEGLDEAARAASAMSWRQLRDDDPEKAASIALEFIAATDFPLDWRRSRVEAWEELRRALQGAELDGVVVILDELGLFLAGKDRRGLNADASFLQWLAQRSAASRCWLICATQRGFEDVGDIDRRTLRQLRDRFRTGFTLDLSGIEWLVAHKIAPRCDNREFTEVIESLCSNYHDGAGEELVSPAELAASYPLNPLCLRALRRAAETCFSRTRSAVKLLQQAARDEGWLELLADRLITPDIVFDVFRDELAMSVVGRKHLEAFETVMANVSRIARGSEGRVATVMKALCVLGVGGLRWTEQMLRAGMVGAEDTDLWQEPAALRSVLQALYLRGGYVERVRGEDGDEYFLDVSSGVAEQIRRRLGELTAELLPEDSRVLRAALEACRDAAFPIAALTEPRNLAVRWMNSRRLVHSVCADLRELDGAELTNQVAALASPMSREDGCLFLASPLGDASEQESVWRQLAGGMRERLAAAVAAWIPAVLPEAAREHLIEHAALTAMIADRTLFRRAGDEVRQKMRERWAASESETRAMLQRAYYEGRVVAANGSELIAPARLWALFGDWEATLSEVFSGPFTALFPRCTAVAPTQPLSGRLHTNQIIDQFIRPAEAMLPPASTLEAHLAAFAAPLGLVEADGRRVRLVLRNADLVQSAIALAPDRSPGDELSPDEAIAVNDLIGRLSKSEWGLTREQGELLLAALLRTGHLVGLDAFLQPVRLDQVAAPLGDNLAYVMRGAPLAGAVAETVQALWRAASGRAGSDWDLAAQESAWGFFITMAENSLQSSEAITRAAVELGHPVEDWDWAREALGRAEALARGVDALLSSREGLTKLATAAERLPGGIQQTCKLLADWHSCNRFLERDLPAVASLRRLVGGIELRDEDGLLAREQRGVLVGLGSPRRVVEETEDLAQSARRWLENYRRHYLAWHAQAHAMAHFEPLLMLRRSTLLGAVVRLGQAGLRPEEAAAIESRLIAALGKRCLAGDPLPEGHAVCPVCGLRFKQELDLPDQADLKSRAEQLLVTQLSEMDSYAEMLRRRAAGIGDATLAGAVGQLLGQETRSCPTELSPFLTDDVVGWLRQQLAQPTARKRELSALVERLRGKELTKAEVLRIVGEWLGEGEMVEIK